MTDREDRTPAWNDPAESGEADGPDEPHPDLADVPDWDDEYLDRVSDRLMHSYDLEKSYREGPERFDMYGRLRVENQKHLFHPALNWANHRAEEHLYVRRVDGVGKADLESLVELGHRLADERIDADEEHFRTDFTFVVVAPRVSPEVASYVADFSDRTMLKFGYYGQYEVNLAVAVPDGKRVVASESADVADAFALWDPVEREPSGLLDRLLGRLKA